VSELRDFSLHVEVKSVDRANGEAETPERLSTRFHFRDCFRFSGSRVSIERQRGGW
jgi:hypothetical protein